MTSDLLNKLDLLVSYILIFLLSCYFCNSKVISVFGVRAWEKHRSKVLCFTRSQKLVKITNNHCFGLTLEDKDECCSRTTIIVTSVLLFYHPKSIIYNTAMISFYFRSYQKKIIVIQRYGYALYLFVFCN